MYSKLGWCAATFLPQPRPLVSIIPGLEDYKPSNFKGIRKRDRRRGRSRKSE